MPTTTSLARLLNDMDFYQDIEKVETVYKVRALDASIREFRRKTVAPWMLKRTTLRVFDGVLEYPVEDDHDEIAFFDESTKTYISKPDFKYTSIPEFYADPNNRNDLAEIWDSGDRFLGVRFKGDRGGNQLLNSAETLSEWTLSGTASTGVKDTVFFKEGNASIRFAVTAGTATVKNTLASSVTDANYKQKYHFKLIYLDAVPTSISLRFHVSASIYLQTTGITTQFSGAPLKADSWNLVAHDLNLATVTGSIATTPTFTYEEFDLVGATAGTYFADSSYLRQWTLLDYWYYSKFYCQTVTAAAPDQEYFMTSAEVYETDTLLVGDSEFSDVMKYDAIKKLFGNIKDKFVKDDINELRDSAWADFNIQYPNLVPIITTSRYNFETDNQPEYDEFLA